MTVRTSASPCAGTLKSNGGMVGRPSHWAARLASDTCQKQARAVRVGRPSVGIPVCSTVTTVPPSSCAAMASVDGAGLGAVEVPGEAGWPSGEACCEALAGPVALRDVAPPELVPVGVQVHLGRVGRATR